jgi:hypothetical protein
VIDQLPAQQRTLYEALKGKGDVAIGDLFCALLPGAEEQERTRQQQMLGPYITRLNRRLSKHRQAVKPGDLKGTYRLVIL